MSSLELQLRRMKQARQLLQKGIVCGEESEARPILLMEELMGCIEANETAKSPGKVQPSGQTVHAKAAAVWICASWRSAR